MLDDETLRKIREKTDEIEEELIRIRRDIHAHPEVRFEERRTGAIVTERLYSAGVHPKTGLAETGLTALIEGKAPAKGKCVGLRADMDAINIQDKKRVEYVSRVEHVAHACGHDVHTVVALGVGIVLASMREHLNGSAKLIFQPSEEIGLHGKSGAREMINDGALENPPLDGIFALHCWPELRAGTVGIGAGPAMAAADSMTLKVQGEGAHAGTPHRGRDAILAACETIAAVHHVIPRNVSPQETAAINFGTIQGGESRAILADQVEALGTLRTTNEETRTFLKKRIEDVAAGMARAYDVKITLDWTLGMPPVINDAGLAELTADVARQVLGPDSVVPMTSCPMTAEDFALFAERVPALYLKLGVADRETGKCFPLHHHEFDVDESAIAVGVKLLSAAMCEFLRR